jgi:pantoate--beta-alanine ligase
VIRARTVAEVRAWRRSKDSLGFVPTMGALHAGHLSLVERARRENDAVAASVFVNPTQFGPNEDLSRYPRRLEEDADLLRAAGCDLLFAPPVEEMYPEGAETFVVPGSVAGPLEGERRPGHFRGVATVVLELLNIVAPTRAYFGEKDAQQLAVIQRMVADLRVDVAIVPCPIVREPDGLAMSSRNAYLSAEERRAATVLHRALRVGEHAWQAGERTGDALRALLGRTIAEEPLARLDYASAADPASFREVETATGPVRLLLAVRVGNTRLIDNLLLS